MGNQGFIEWAASIAALRPALEEFLDAPTRDSAAAVLKRNPGLAAPDIIETVDKLAKMHDEAGNTALSRRNRERRAMLQAARR